MKGIFQLRFIHKILKLKWHLKKVKEKTGIALYTVLASITFNITKRCNALQRDPR